MAASKILSVLQLPKLIPSTCWNTIQRNYVSERSLLKKMGYPEKPKKPLTPFLHFVIAQRAAVETRYPGKKFGEISVVLGKQWKSLSEAERQKYAGQYKEEMEEYRLKMEAYNKLLTDKQKQEVKELMIKYTLSKKEKAVSNEKKKMEKELNKPKNPVSPFVLYYFSKRIEKKGKEALPLKEVSKLWNELSESEKKKYRDAYNIKRDEYLKELKKWELEMIEQGNVDLVRVKTLKERLQNPKP